MADQDYPTLYEDMEESAQRTRAAAIAFEHVLGGPEADMVPVNGYPDQPTIAGRVKARVDPLVDTLESAAESVKRFAGVHPNAPTTRTDGTPLQAGDEYQNSTNNLRYSYSGNAWVVLNASVQALSQQLASSSGGGSIGLQDGKNVEQALADLGTEVDQAQASDVEMSAELALVPSKIATAVANRVNGLSIADMRMTYHYHYEFDTDGKLERLKSMGLNTIFCYLSSPWMRDIARSRAWLDSIQKHGLCAWFQAHPELVRASVTAPTAESTAHMAWIAGVDDHPALFGWAGNDEPAAHKIPIADQALFASTMRARSKKLLLGEEAGHTLDLLDGWYRSDTFDVFLLANYVTQYPDEATFKLQHTRPIFNFLSYGGGQDAGNKRPHRKIIPVLSAFAGEGFTAPTKAQARWAVEAWRPFVAGSSYAVFAHDILSPGYTTLDNSEDLRNQVKSLMTTWGGQTGHGYSLLTAVGYRYSQCFLERTNVARGQYNYRFFLGPAGAGDYSLTLKHDVAPGTRFVILYAKFINSLDSNPRMVHLEVNDGEPETTPWVTVQSVEVRNAPDSADVMWAYPVNGNARSMAFRCRVAPGSSPNTSGQTGIMAIGAANT